jgi:hypothetical protein
LVVVVEVLYSKVIPVMHLVDTMVVDLELTQIMMLVAAVVVILPFMLEIKMEQV